MAEIIKDLSLNDMESVAGGANTVVYENFLQALIDVCKYDIGRKKIAELVKISKREAKEYVMQNALPFMRKRCPGHSDATLQSNIDALAVKAINSVL